MKYDISGIKDRITCIEYANKVLAYPITAAGQRCVAKYRGGDNSTSLMINERDWWDFGTNTGGDVIDLAAIVSHAGDKRLALEELSGMAGLTPDIKFDVDFKMLNHQAAFYHQNLKAEHREYLHKRGIKDETIDELLIGWAENDGQWQNRIMIPYWKGGNVVYFAGRALGETPNKYMKMKKTPYTEHVIWGMHTIQREGPVVIAEGAFDALSCYQENFAVLSPITGRFSNDQFKDLISLIRGREIIICMDYDPKTKAGQNFSIVLAERLLNCGINSKLVFLDGSNEKVDISSLYAAGRDIREILFNCNRPATEVCAESRENREELARYLFRIARRFPWPDVAELLQCLPELKLKFKLVPSWMSALEQQLHKPPSDDVILKELKEKFVLIYHDKLGWFEYNSSSGVWKQKTDDEIRGHISDLLGHFKTGQKINSVYTTARAEFIFPGAFNSNMNFLNFSNGMLEISSGRIVPHSQSYYSTIQINYQYSKDADCPNWRSFIDDITAGDETRQYLLQEMFGYCLSPDTRYQKCFFLIGSGANGKSVLLDILSRMVDKENVSNVEISALTEPFQRISLYGKMVNICTETKSDVKGAETVFKQIVAGDDIAGCYKGKDFFTFKPRVKMISAANEYFESKDLSYGFLRRICFIDFPVKFVDNPNPKKESERKKDRNIIDTLLTELPGILNWALQGLKVLNERGEFTQTVDQENMMKQFVLLSNPLQEFLDDILEILPPKVDIRYTRNEVYDAYISWCGKTNCRPMSRRKFMMKFKDYTGYEEYKNHGERGFLVDGKKEEETANDMF